VPAKEDEQVNMSRRRPNYGSCFYQVTASNWHADDNAWRRDVHVCSH